MLSSRSLLNIALIALIATLAATAYFTSQKTPPPVQFSRQKASEINRIKITYDKNTIELSKQAKAWLITAPRKIQADDFRINTILNITRSLPEKFYPLTQSENKLKQYALDPALAVLTLNDKEYRFGTTSAVGDKRYVWYEQKLFLVDDTFFPLITAGYKNLMRRQLMPVAEKIATLSWDKTRVFKNEKGSWQAMTESNNATRVLPISGDQIKRYIDNWTHIQAYAVYEATPPYRGTKVNITTDKGSYSFNVLKTDSNTTVINTDLGLSYQFDISSFKSLLDLASFSEQQ